MTFRGRVAFLLQCGHVCLAGPAFWYVVAGALVAPPRRRTSHTKKPPGRYSPSGCGSLRHWWVSHQGESLSATLVAHGVVAHQKVISTSITNYSFCRLAGATTLWSMNSVTSITSTTVLLFGRRWSRLCLIMQPARPPYECLNVPTVRRWWYFRKR